MSLNYIKMPRNISEYSLMKGMTDFSNLKQFDLYESGYSFLTVVGVPRYLKMIEDQRVQDLLDGFVHIMEGEFRGLTGLPDISADPTEISNGYNTINLVNNVTMETSISVSMNFYERSGSLITNFLNYYLTGIKDPYTKAKTYHGLIASNAITDPGPDWEVFTFLYYVTDNTMRKVEKAYLLCNAQPTTVPTSEMYESAHGTYEFKDLGLTFNCYPIVGDQVNKYAAMMLQNDLTTSDNKRKIVLDSNNYEYSVYKNTAESSERGGQVADILGNDEIATEVLAKTQYGEHLGNGTSDRSKDTQINATNGLRA